MVSQLAIHARDAAVLLGRWLSRPRVRLTVTGVLLLVVGGVFVTGSVWTLPLLIAGVLMIAIAWVGHRLDGRLAVEWGQGGTQLEFRAQLKAAESPHAALAEPEDADVVEGEAHTVEIEVAELRALIAAAETTEIPAPPTEEAAHAARNLRAAQ